MILSLLKPGTLSLGPCSSVGVRESAPEPVSQALSYLGTLHLSNCLLGISQCSSCSYFTVCVCTLTQTGPCCCVFISAGLRCANHSLQTLSANSSSPSHSLEPKPAIYLVCLLDIFPSEDCSLLCVPGVVGHESISRQMHLI